MSAEENAGQNNFLDPYAVLTDEEERALNHIFAHIDPATVQSANVETARLRDARARSVSIDDAPPLPPLPADK